MDLLDEKLPAERVRVQQWKAKRRYDALQERHAKAQQIWQTLIEESDSATKVISPLQHFCFALFILRYMSTYFARFLTVDAMQTKLLFHCRRYVTFLDCMLTKTKGSKLNGQGITKKIRCSMP
jgi:hypothetical protein